MKKVYLMKGMAAMTLGLVVASCNKADIFNAYADQEVKEQEFTENFQNNVMGGKTIDPNQNWSTAVQSTVCISVNLDYDAEYTIFLFSDDPNTNANAKYLGLAKVKSGASTSISFAKPADVTALYAACVDKKGNYFAQRFAIEGTTASVNIGSTAKNAVARRAATTVNGVDVNPDSYKRNATEFIDNLKDYDNNWASYYDMSTVDANDKLNKGGYEGNPAYGDNRYFILPQGKEFTLTSTNMSAAWNDMVIVVRGTLTIPADYAECRLYDKQTIVIDGGTVICNAPKLTCANGSNIINIGGSLQLNGTLFDYANGSEKGFGNFGTIKGTNGAGVNFAGSWDDSYYYYNAGSIDFTDNGFIKFNGNLKYINVGHIHAYNSDANATIVSDYELGRGGSNATVVNICDMTFEKFFSVNNYIGTSNSLLCAKGGLYINQGGRVTLGSQAMITCGDWFDCGVQVAASTVADEYAVFQVTGDVDEQNGGMTGATGYAYFDIAGEIKGKGKTEADIYTDGPWHITNFKNNMLTYTVSEATAPANITIAKDENGCNYIGYHEGEGNKTFEPNYIYYAFEDLGTTDDFDFNDVVIRVSAPNANGDAIVELMAAGGTLPTNVTYNGTSLGEEVHQVFGVEVATMVNTGAEKKEFKTLGTIRNLSADTDMTTLPFGITVKDYNGQVTRVVNSVENNGKAPLMIIVSGDENGKWFWATERTNITAAYAQFGEWGANASSNADWYKNYADGKVWKW